MRGILCAASLVLVALAGCAETDDPTPAPAATGGSQFVDDDKDFSVDRPTLPRAPPAPGERTLNEAPQWRLGEWWQYRITDAFTGVTRDVLRVVAGSEHGNYLVGFPVEAFSNDVLVLHVPGYGDINGADISYAAHDVPYAPVQFPLVEGATWTTHFESPTNELEFLVERVDEENQTAYLLAGGGQGSGTFVYDAEVGEITRWISPSYADYEIVAHGYNWTGEEQGYSGVIRVPHDHDLIFMNGRIAGVLDAGAPFPPNPTTFNPKLPDETVVIEGGYDRLSFAIILVDLTGGFAGGAPVAPGTAGGYYQITATAPNGDVYTDTLTPADGVSTKVTFFGHDEPPEGTWNIQSIAGGAGVALLEGIGYHSIDIELPSGCVIASANADHHENLADC